MAIELVAANYTAIVAATVVSFIIGFIWHGLIFGKAWGRLMGIEMSKKGMAPKMVAHLIAVLIFTFVLFQLFAWTGVTALMDALTLGFWVWLGFFATVGLGVVLWLNKSVKVFVINEVGSLITTLVAAAVLVSV